MNRVASCIKLIQILSSNNDYINSKDLAEILETNPRNIREFIKEIEVAGYTVKSTQGIYGGYKLDNSSLLPSVNITNEEELSLLEIKNILKELNDNNLTNYENVLGKLKSSNTNNKNEISPLTMIDKFPLSMSKTELNKRYVILQEAIDSQFKVEINYTTNNSNSIHIIHPYKLFVYNGGFFILAYNETVNNFGYFKLNRINDIYKTRNHFSIIKNYNELDYIDSFGMKQNGDYYDIELEISNLNSMIKEKIYGKNQKINEIDSNKLILSCSMQNKNIIKSFVLSLGNNCRVIKPDWLKDEIKEELWSLMELYED